MWGGVVERTITGGIVLLLFVFLMRGPSRIVGIRPVDGMCASAVESLLQDAPVRSPSKKQRPVAASIPESYIRSPLAFLSRASVDSLILLKGIGPVLAERITEARTGKRPFSSWDEILSVKGIGPKKLKLLKSQAGIIE